MQAKASVGHFRFGILVPTAEGTYEVQSETTTIPRHLKDSGFRFGVGFENPDCASLRWYQIVYLPAEARSATGNMHRHQPRILKTELQESAQASIVDDFWFDEGDPLGPHKMVLVVNDSEVFSVDFEVVLP